MLQASKPHDPQQPCARTVIDVQELGVGLLEEVDVRTVGHRLDVGDDLCVFWVSVSLKLGSGPDGCVVV